MVFSEQSIWNIKMNCAFKNHQHKMRKCINVLFKKYKCTFQKINIKYEAKLYFLKIINVMYANEIYFLLINQKKENKLYF